MLPRLTDDSTPSHTFSPLIDDELFVLLSNSTGGPWSHHMVSLRNRTGSSSFAQTTPWLGVLLLALNKEVLQPLLCSWGCVRLVGTWHWGCPCLWEAMALSSRALDHPKRPCFGVLSGALFDCLDSRTCTRGTTESVKLRSLVSWSSGCGWTTNAVSSRWPLTCSSKRLAATQAYPIFVVIKSLVEVAEPIPEEQHCQWVPTLESKRVAVPAFDVT